MGDRGVMSDGLRAALIEEDLSHPHRCQAGHRWQHAGPTALTCVIPAHDATGDLPIVGPEDCPVCSGRDDVLVRAAHIHYCTICDGDWIHEGRCLEGLPAWCPWCRPLEGTPPTAARTGPHSHYCPDCGSSWRHSEDCTAPLEAVLPDCSGCANRDERPLATAAARPIRAVRSYHLVRPLAMTLSLAACAFLSGSFVLRHLPAFRTSTPPIREQPRVVEPPRVMEPPATRTPAPVAIEREPTPAPSVVARLPQGEPAALPQRKPPALPRRESASAKRAREVSPRVSPPELPPPAILPPPVAGSRATEPVVPLSPMPSPAPLASEPAVESPIQKPERLVAVPMEVPVTKPSIPGAPVGALGGAAGWEAFLERHPRPVDETSRAENRSR